MRNTLAKVNILLSFQPVFPAEFHAPARPNRFSCKPRTTVFGTLFFGAL
jgi:hypothetical protein